MRVPSDAAIDPGHGVEGIYCVGCGRMVEIGRKRKVPEDGEAGIAFATEDAPPALRRWSRARAAAQYRTRPWRAAPTGWRLTRRSTA